MMAKFAASLLLTAILAHAAWAINGDALVLRSGGTQLGSAWRIDNNGYVGTYITLPAAGPVTVTVNAQGAASGGTDPHMNLVLNDDIIPFSVGAAAQDYQHTFHLPAGTHFVRTEMNNDAAQTGRSLTINTLDVDGATVNNAGGSATLNANAIAAANTYIDNYRKGNVQIGLSGAAPGTEVEVSLKRHAFNFGTAVAGGNLSNLMNANPAPGSNAFKYQEALLKHFNALVPENAGKWIETEFNRDSQWHPQLDKIVAFAAANDMRLRAHNLIWGSQQPNWVQAMFNNPNGTDGATGLTNAQALRGEILERIAYYVGDGVGNDPAQGYAELDVYNETVHTPQYWNIYGAEGVAEIYNEVAAAVSAADANTKLFTNEYNILQDSGDYYGNWYRENIEEILAAGGAVSGVGIQSYENNAIGTTFDAHNVGRKFQTLQNLSVLGMPIVLTEFGVKDPTNQTDAAIMMEDTMRLMFGTPNATGFFMWGFWRGDIYRGAAALYDANFNLTQAGMRWEDLFSIDEDGDENDDWNTQLTAVVGEDGTINFNGFYGDYEITINGQTYNLAHVKGDLLSSIVIAAGDFNGDGVVDAADYTVWRNAMDAPGDMRADGNGDELVDLADYEVWRTNYGNVYVPGSGGIAAVPEPGTALLLVMGLAVVAGRRGRDGRAI